MTLISTARRRHSEAIWSLVLPLTVFFVGGLIWQVLARDSASLIIPTFLETIRGVFDLLFVEGRIWGALLNSNEAFVVGYVISVAVGIPLGLALARVKNLDDFANPYINMWIAMPIAPLIPLILMALGIGLAARVAVVVIFALIYIIVNTKAGVRGVDESLVEMARSFGADNRDIWRRVLLPGAAPAILAGLRLGMARAFDGMIVAELLLVAVGIGNLLLIYRSSFEGGLMFATVIVVAFEASILISLMRTIERKLTPWL